MGFYLFNQIESSLRERGMPEFCVSTAQHKGAQGCNKALVNEGIIRVNLRGKRLRAFQRSCQLGTEQQGPNGDQGRQALFLHLP